MICKVKITDKGKTVTLNAEAGKTLHAVLTENGFFVDAVCGGNGKCGRCIVNARGELSAPSSEELKILAGRAGRLACRACVLGDCEVNLSCTAGMKVSTGFTGLEGGFAFEPWAKGLGAAVDIGTTTVVVYLYDLESGRALGVLGEPNGQRAFGADVMSRISNCMEDSARLKKMTFIIRTQIAGMIKKLVTEAKRGSTEVAALCVCGNTVMEHLFCGLSPVSMAALPFEPESLFGEGFFCGAEDMGFKQNCKIFVLPAVSAFVGGDITAAALALSTELERTVLIADIGTNGELVLACGGRLFCAATAAGPAFEGGGIGCGMPGMPGAISGVSYENGDIKTETIGGGEPLGICGSGLIDALAVCLECGALDETGRLCDESEFVTRLENGKLAFNLGSGVYIEEGDVRSLQLAKAAVAAGMETLLDEAGISTADVETLYIAGGFGSNIKLKAAGKVGLLPKGLAPRALSVGNAAGQGACLALISASARAEAGRIRDRMKYIDLSADARFMDHYIEQMMF